MSVFYRLGDESAAVRSLQSSLRFIAARDGRIPSVFIDGIYGAETVAAVSAFQEVFGRPVTGEVDFITHRALGEEYGRLLLGEERLEGSPDFDSFPDGAISRDDAFEGVTALQLLLRRLASYDDAFMIQPDGVYGSETDSAVRKFQRLRGLNEESFVDRALWNELARFSERRSENN